MKELIKRRIRNNSKKDNARDFVIASVVFILIIAALFMAVRIAADYRLYNNYKHQYEYMINTLVEQAGVINELQQTEEESEMKLYDDINAYYKELSNNDKLTKDEKVFCGVFEQTFPSEEDVKKNKRQAYIKIYALLENYPEVKGHGDINKTMRDIEITTRELSKAVKDYNFYVDKYDSSVDSINGTRWVKYHKSLRIDENIFTKAVML